MRDAVAERVAGARARHQNPRRLTGALERGHVAGGEVHGVELAQLVPVRRAGVARRVQPLAERGDRALARLVDDRHGAARGGGRDRTPALPFLSARFGLRGLQRRLGCGLVQHPHPELTQAPARGPSGLVLPEHCEQAARACQPRELHGRDRATPGRLVEGAGGVGDLAGARKLLHTTEQDPLDVADDGD